MPSLNNETSTTLTPDIHNALAGIKPTTLRSLTEQAAITPTTLKQTAIKPKLKSRINKRYIFFTFKLLNSPHYSNKH